MFKNIGEKIYNWVHVDEHNRKQIANRALLVACSPLIIGTILAFIILGLISLFFV